MSQQQNALLSNQEGRIALAIQAYRTGQFKSLRHAAKTFNLPHSSLIYRYNGRAHRPAAPPNGRKLTLTEEETVVRYILDLDARGFPPLKAEVGDIADKILAERGAEPVGKNWVQRFVAREERLKMAFNRAKDIQRIRQEDPEIIGAWFRLVEETIAKYGIHNKDIHNFDETGFQMGVIGSMKVITGSERRARPELVQPGDREWVTVIQSICAAGYAIPPFIIYKGRVHISAWYEEADIPRDWKLSVSENGWTNNELGVAWLKHFDAHTKMRQVGSNRLLIHGHFRSFIRSFRSFKPFLHVKPFNRFRILKSFKQLNDFPALAFNENFLNPAISVSIHQIHHIKFNISFFWSLYSPSICRPTHPLLLMLLKPQMLMDCR